MRNDHCETEEEQAVWQRGYDIGLAHEGEVPPLMKLSAMTSILARITRPLDQEPAHDKGGATRAPSLHRDGARLDLADAAVKRMIKLGKMRGTSPMTSSTALCLPRNSAWSRSGTCLMILQN